MVVPAFWFTCAIVCAAVLQDVTVAAPHSPTVNTEESLTSEGSNVTLKQDEVKAEYLIPQQNETITLDKELETESEDSENKTLVKRHFCKKCGGGGGGGKVIYVPVVVVPVKVGGGGCKSKLCGQPQSTCGHGGCGGGGYGGGNRGGGCGGGGCGGGSNGGGISYSSASATAISYGK